MITPGDAFFGTRHVLGQVAAERKRQDAKFPDQTLPDGTGEEYLILANIARAACDFAALTDELTWAHVLKEEFYEALAEVDEAKLRAELVQVSAVACRWIEDIDRRLEHENERLRLQLAETVLA